MSGVILEACNHQKHEMYKHCNQKLPTLTKQDGTKWERTSNSGPWSGNRNVCYEVNILKNEKDNSKIAEVTLDKVITDTSIKNLLNDPRFQKLYPSVFDKKDEASIKRLEMALTDDKDKTLPVGNHADRNQRIIL